MYRLCCVTLVCLATAVAGCGGDDGPALPPDACNPLGGVGCVAPWPSAVYQVDDAQTVTGTRLAFPDGALPVNVDGVPIDTTRFSEHDGFSPAAFAFTAFDKWVDASALVGHTDVERSLTDDSPTVVIDMETGERVLHFAEVDANVMYEFDPQAVYIRPYNALLPNRRYAVGIRKSLRAADGSELAMPAGFRAILDGRKTTHPLLEAVRPRYDAIFAAFEQAGIDRDDLLVAWDFSTASEAMLTGPALGARDAAVEAMGPLAQNMSYAIDNDDVINSDGGDIRRLRGTFQAPLVISDVKAADGHLNRDNAGQVVVDGTMDAKFAALIPACAAAQAPVPIVVFGHGFFGDLGEVQGSYLQHVATSLCVIVVGTEWTGMARSDLANTALALNEASGLVDVGERIIQGIVNVITLEQLARGKLASEVMVDGATALADPTRVFFYGISQGGILGATFMAYDPFITQGVLGVAGSNWSLLFERSTNWPPFQLIISGAYPGDINTLVIESLLQMGLDPIENLHVARHVVADPLPGTPAKQVLLQVAVNDSQVTNLSSELLARELGIESLAPALPLPYGLSEADGPLSSALVMFDENATPLPPDSNLRHAVTNGTHNSVRWQPAVVRQIDGFFTNGEVVNTCNGTCDCAAGNCD